MRITGVVFAMFLLWSGLSASHAEIASTNVVELTLDEFLQRVAERNETVQMRVLEVAASMKLKDAEKGAFEPEVFGGASHEEQKRQNTIQEERSQLSSIFEEENNIYQGGVENLIPSGAKIRLGYTLRDLRNNLQSNPVFGRGATNGEYHSFIGLSLTQPLLKNAGIDANMARLRIAALGSMIAFQEYRKQSMLVLSTAESTYWQMFLLQEQIRFLEQSVKTAETVLNDSKVRLDAGRGSELDVLEARAGLATRQSLLAEARQKVREASNQMATLFSERLAVDDREIRVVTRPEIVETLPLRSDVYSVAFESNPDYLMQIQKAARDGVALRYARNQRLPELNLKGSYGFSGLSDDPGRSWDEVTSTDWPSWSVGIEFRVPLGGGIRGRNELESAHLREQQSLLGLRSMETQLLNTLDTAVHRISETSLNASNYQSQVILNESVLDAALARLEVGQIESRKVLEIEARLLETKSAEVEALANHRKSVVELQFLEGSLLQRRSLDFTQKDLEAATENFVRSKGMDRERYAEFIRTAQNLQDIGGGGPWPEEGEEMQEMRSEVKAKAELLDRDDGFIRSKDF